jgi:hypothetical protein
MVSTSIDTPSVSESRMNSWRLSSHFWPTPTDPAGRRRGAVVGQDGHREHRAVFQRLLADDFQGVNKEGIPFDKAGELKYVSNFGVTEYGLKDAKVILHMLHNGMSQRYHDPLVAGINDGA